MILIEATAAVNSAGALETYYLSDADFITEPSDTPANIEFISRLKNAGSIGLHVYSDGKTGGASKLETGEITLANIDGEFDHWKDLSFTGRPLVIRSGTGGAYPSAFAVVFTGTVESVEVTWDLVIIRLRDKQFILDRPVAATRYAGSNVGPVGLEGTSADLKDKPKPMAWGAPSNIVPPCVNTSTKVYQVNDGAVSDIPAVYVRGVRLTKGADHATSALLVAASITDGSYETCFAEGLFGVDMAIDGQVTADVVQGASNLLLYSEDFTNAAWSKTGATVTANAELAPDGTLTADKLVETATTDVHRVFQTITVAAEATIVHSVRVKPAERTKVRIQIENGGAVVRARFDLVTGEVTQEPTAGGTLAGCGVAPLPDGSFVCWVSGSLTGLTTYHCVIYLLEGTDPFDQEYAGDGASGLYVWGDQANNGAAPGPYVRTASTAVTATDPTWSVAQVLKALALDAGLTLAEISAEDVAALDTLNPAVIGLYIADGETFRSAMDRVAASIGAYYLFDPLGVLRMGVLTAPEGSPLLTLYDYDIGKDVQIKPARDNNIPVWSVTVRHSKLGLVQASDLAGSVDTERRAYLAEEYRSAKYEDPAIKDQHLLATEMQVDTLLTNEADALALAERLFRMHSVGRLRFEVSAPIDLLTGAGIWLVRILALDLGRFGLAGGRSFRVLGLAPDLSKKRAFLSIWG